MKIENDYNESLSSNRMLALNTEQRMDALSRFSIQQHVPNGIRNSVSKIDINSINAEPLTQCHVSDKIDQNHYVEAVPIPIQNSVGIKNVTPNSRDILRNPDSPGKTRIPLSSSSRRRKSSLSASNSIRSGFQQDNCMLENKSTSVSTHMGHRRSSPQSPRLSRRAHSQGPFNSQLSVTSKPSQQSHKHTHFLSSLRQQPKVYPQRRESNDIIHPSVNPSPNGNTLLSNKYLLDKSTDNSRKGHDINVASAVSAQSFASSRLDYTIIQPVSVHGSAGRLMHSAGMTSSTLRRHYKDLENLNGFEDITLDPTKFSSERVKRDAAAVILRYLKLKNYVSCPTIQELVQCQSTTMYKEIIQFLFSQVDTVSDHSSFDEKVTTIFKDLGYPVSIAKSHFRTPCAPLTWPQHLASLAWLCALLLLDEKILRQLSTIPVTVSNTIEPECPQLSVAQTPRVIGGTRPLLYEELCFKSGTGGDSLGRSERQTMSSVIQIPFSSNTFNLDFPTSGKELCIGKEECPKAAAIRTIQTAYMSHRQQGKEVDHVALLELMAAEANKLKPNLEAALQQSAIECQTERDSFELEKKKLHAIEELKIQMERQMTDCLTLEQNIAQAESAILEKNLHIDELHNKCHKEDLNMNELQKTAEKLRTEIMNQPISKMEADHLQEQSYARRDRLEQKRHQVKQIKTNLINYSNKIEEVIDDIESTSTRYTQRLLKMQNSLEAFPGTPGRSHIVMSSLPRLSVSLTQLTIDKIKNLIELRTRVQPQTFADGSPLPEPIDLSEVSSEHSDDIVDCDEYGRETEKILKTICNGVDWITWKHEMERAINAQEDSRKKIHLKIEEQKRQHNQCIGEYNTKQKELEDLRKKIKQKELKIGEVKQDATSKSSRLEIEKNTIGTKYNDELMFVEQEHQRLQKDLSVVKKNLDKKKTELKNLENSLSEQFNKWLATERLEMQNATQFVNHCTQIIQEQNSKLKSLLEIYGSIDPSIKNNHFNNESGVDHLNEIQFLPRLLCSSVNQTF